ncbi:MAG: hypothetical protein M3464_03885 [Chloroflexota bacterium]|nr:hypothetical protein [Chloroflexota bacterium]
MEIAVVILILLLVIAGGLGALILLGGDAGPGALWAGRRLPRPTARPQSRRVIDVPPEDAKPVVSRLESAGREETNSRLDQLTAEVRATLASGDDRLIHLNRQLEALQLGLQGRLEHIGLDANERWGELAARQEASSERLRADLTARLTDAERARSDLTRQLGERERQAASQFTGERAAVTAELYALLARLEGAFAAVTNPILLPGEPYVPPAEFLPESLVWENWKEVGERTFTFADLYSARRLYLNEATRDEVGAFVVELRGLLTASIYPSLRPNPGPSQRETLRQALETLAMRFAAVRIALEGDFRAIAEPNERPPATGSGNDDTA